MATVNLGRVSFVMKGAYSSSATYKRQDVVTDGGASYAAKKDVPANTALTNTEYWQKLVETVAGVEIGDTATYATTELLFNPEGTNEHTVPEVDDDSVSEGDTWSSSKINGELSDLKSALTYKADNVYGGDTTDYALSVTAGKGWNDQTGLAGDNTKRAVAGGILIHPDMKLVSIASGYIMLLYGNNAGDGNALTPVQTWTANNYNLSNFRYKYMFVTIARSDIGVITGDDLTNVLKIEKYDSILPFALQQELDATNAEVSRINGAKTYSSKNLLNPAKFNTVGQYYTSDAGAAGSHNTSTTYISYDDLIPVESGKTYTLSQDGVVLTAVSLLMIDSTGTVYLSGGYNQSGTFTTTADTKYLRLTISKSKYDNGKIMLAQESAASAYVPWYQPYQIGIREEVDALLSEASTPTGNIVCWGDSLTYGTGATAGNSYPERLATLTGKVVHSCGFPGDTSIEIAGMQGAIPMIVAPVTIPASGAVNVTIYDAARSEDYPFRFPSIDAAAGVNPVKIGGIEGNLDLSASGNTDSRVFAFTRSEAGQAVQLSWYTPIITACSEARKADIQVIFVGTNGGWNSNIDILIDQISAMAENQNIEIKKFIVVGLTTGTAASRSELELKMLMKFGKHYVNAREYLATQAVYDEGLTPTSQDLADMAEGKVPESLRYKISQTQTDPTHLNDDGYDALANLVYNRGKDLGYW